MRFNEPVTGRRGNGTGSSFVLATPQAVLDFLDELPSEKHSDLDFRDLQAKCRRAIESGNEEAAHQEAWKAAVYFIRLGKHR